MDVTETDKIKPSVEQAESFFGRIDVLVNNAGYGLLGAVEETTHEQTVRQFNVNVFGLLNLTRAVLPIMRKQHSGFIINMSSIAGIGAAPGFGMYNASKFAVEGLSEALAQEVGVFGIKVMIVEPGPFRTEFAGRSGELSEEMEIYKSTAGNARRYIENVNGKQVGDPHLGALAIIKAVEAPTPPLRLPLGKMAYGRLDAKIKSLTKDYEDWKEVAQATDFAE